MVGEVSVVCTEILRPDLVIQKGNDIIIYVKDPFDDGLDAFTEAKVNKTSTVNWPVSSLFMDRLLWRRLLSWGPLEVGIW